MVSPSAIKRKDIAMCNELLTIGPVTIYGYGLMIGIGILVGLFTGTYRAKKHGLKSDYIYNIVFWVLIFGFLCAKLLYCIVEFDSYQRPAQLAFRQRICRLRRHNRRCCCSHSLLQNQKDQLP